MAHVNNTVLTSCIRPQPPYQCSANAVAAALNALLGKSYVAQDIIDTMSWGNLVGRGKIGNGGMCKALRKAGGPKIVTWLKLDTNNLWETCVANVHSDVVMILHEIGHYTLICGYIEEPRQMVIAEQSPTRGPLMRLLPYSKLLEIVNTEDRYGLICVGVRSPKLWDIIQTSITLGQEVVYDREEAYDDVTNEVYHALDNYYSNRTVSDGIFRTFLVGTCLVLSGPDGSTFVFRRTIGSFVMEHTPSTFSKSVLDEFEANQVNKALLIGKDKIYKAAVRALKIYAERH